MISNLWGSATSSPRTRTPTSPIHEHSRPPKELEWVTFLLVGENWPKGDEDGMDRLGQTWKQLGVDLAPLQGQLDAVLVQLQAAGEGPALDAARDYISKISGGSNSALPMLKKAIDDVSTGAHKVALEIQYAKLMIIAMAGILLYMLIKLAYLAFMTFGAAGVAAPPLIELFKQLVSRVLQRLVLSVIQGALFMAGLDVAVQSFQILILHSKDWKDWDLKKTGFMAGIGGLGGAIGWGLGFMRKLPFGHSLFTTVVKNALAEGLPELIADAIQGQGGPDIGARSGFAGGLLSGAVEGFIEHPTKLFGRRPVFVSSTLSLTLGKLFGANISIGPAPDVFETFGDKSKSLGGSSLFSTGPVDQNPPPPYSPPPPAYAPRSEAPLSSPGYGDLPPAYSANPSGTGSSGNGPLPSAPPGGNVGGGVSGDGVSGGGSAGVESLRAVVPYRAVRCRSALLRLARRRLAWVVLARVVLGLVGLGVRRLARVVLGLVGLGVRRLARVVLGLVGKCAVGAGGVGVGGVGSPPVGAGGVGVGGVGMSAGWRGWCWGWWGWESAGWRGWCWGGGVGSPPVGAGGVGVGGVGSPPVGTGGVGGSAAASPPLGGGGGGAGGTPSVVGGPGAAAPSVGVTSVAVPPATPSSGGAMPPVTGPSGLSTTTGTGQQSPLTSDVGRPPAASGLQTGEARGQASAPTSDSSVRRDLNFAGRRDFELRRFEDVVGAALRVNSGPADVMADIHEEWLQEAREQFDSGFAPLREGEPTDAELLAMEQGWNSFFDHVRETAALGTDSWTAWAGMTFVQISTGREVEAAVEDWMAQHPGTVSVASATLVRDELAGRARAEFLAELHRIAGAGNPTEAQVQQAVAARTPTAVLTAEAVAILDSLRHGPGRRTVCDIGDADALGAARGDGLHLGGRDPPLGRTPACGRTERVETLPNGSAAATSQPTTSTPTTVARPSTAAPLQTVIPAGRLLSGPVPNQQFLASAQAMPTFVQSPEQGGRSWFTVAAQWDRRLEACISAIGFSRRNSCRPGQGLAGLGQSPLVWWWAAPLDPALPVFPMPRRCEICSGSTLSRRPRMCGQIQRACPHWHLRADTVRPPASMAVHARPGLAALPRPARPHALGAHQRP